MSIHTNASLKKFNEINVIISEIILGVFTSSDIIELLNTSPIYQIINMIELTESVMSD